MEPTHNCISIIIHQITNKSQKSYIRFFWFLIILMAFICLYIYLPPLFIKFIGKPVIDMKVEDNSIDLVPFPAITFCTGVFAKNNIVAQFDNPSEFDEDRKRIFAINFQACNPTFIQHYPNCCGSKTDEDVIDILDRSSLSVDEVFAICSFNNFRSNCSLVVNRILTDRGFCYRVNAQGYHAIFNPGVISEDFDYFKLTGLSKSFLTFDDLFNDTSSEEFSDWSMERGFQPYHHSYSIPIRAKKNMKMSFHLFLDSINEENICIDRGKLFTFFLHPANEIVTPFHDDGSVEYGFEKRVTITVTGYNTDESLRNFPPNSRGCYYNGEKSLKFFRIYTKNHCEFECLTNFTLRTCGCVKFSMPRMSGTQICGMDKVKCYNDIWRIWPYYVPGKGQEAPCGCLKTCNHLEYTMRSERNSVYDEIEELEGVRNVTEGSAYSFLSFEINDHFLRDYKFYGPYTFQNFIGDIGGLLGLFLGISILSIFECLYALLSFIFQRLFQKRKNDTNAAQINIGQTVYNRKNSGVTKSSKKLNKTLNSSLQNKIIMVEPRQQNLDKDSQMNSLRNSNKLKALKLHHMTTKKSRVLPKEACETVEDDLGSLGYVYLD